MVRSTNPQQPRHIDTTAADVSIPPKEEDEKQGASDTIDDGVHEEMELPKELPEIIGDGLAACMRDRKEHLRVEHQIDDWIRNLSPNKHDRQNQLRDAREQMETAKLALEVFYMRFRSLATTAKN